MNAQIEVIKHILTSIGINYIMETPTSLTCELGRVMEFKGQLRFSEGSLKDIVESFI
jgi:hypothetical protein